MRSTLKLKNDHTDCPLNEKVPSHFEQDCSIEATQDHPTVGLQVTLPSLDNGRDHSNALG